MKPPTSRLYRIKNDGSRVRFVDSLDECFAPTIEMRAFLRPGRSFEVENRSNRISLVPGEYVFVVRYQTEQAMPVRADGTLPFAELEARFFVQ